MASFGLVGKEFINLYSKENPILETDDICYFLFTNNIDYHRPLVGRGIIIEDKFSDGMHKVYYVRLYEIIENPNIINEFVNGKPFIVFPFSTSIHNRKLIQVTPNFSFQKNLFKIDAFFIRKTEEKINELRQEYIQVLRKDVAKQLKDIENMYDSTIMK